MGTDPLSIPPVPDDILIETLKVYSECETKTEAAKRLGIARSSFDNRLIQAARRGLDGSVPKPLPQGQVIKGVSTLYRIGKDGADEILQWVKTENQRSLEDVVQYVKEAFADYAGRSQLSPAPADPNPDLLTIYPVNDWHLGLYVWGQEADQNWDLSIAEKSLGDGMSSLIACSPSSDTAVILGGGDYLHSDNNENRTARSGNALDVDGRHGKVFHVSSRLAVHSVDLALEKHQHVIIRFLKGNHDEYSAIALAYFLMAWYRNEPRVTVDVDPSLFWWHRFGLCLFGATHGHTVKIKDMPSIMAHRRAEDWGATKFRYIHGFHLHHSAKIATEGNGCICEVHQAPIPQDAWHYGAGFLSGRSLQAITYHRNFGEVSRNRRALISDCARRE